jgi:hypothetical protein
LTHIVFRDLPSDPIHVALYIIHLFDTYCFQRFTIRSYTRGSLYYTFIWHMLFSRDLPSDPIHLVLYTIHYLTHIVFRDLPSDPIYVVIYIIHLFDTCCFQRFTIRSYTCGSLYYTFIWQTMFIKHYYLLLWNGHMILMSFFSDPTSNVFVRLLQESENAWLGNQYIIKNQLTLDMLWKLCYYYYISLFS